MPESASADWWWRRELTNPLVSLLALLVTLGVLISFHEFGHFWVARRLGVKVLRFSIGFGRPLWLRRGATDGTEYVVAAIPFGGYVRMLDEREGEVASHERHRAFNRQSVWSRIAIVIAGPLFNFLLAILIYSAIFMIGVPALRPILAEPAPGSIAAASGFQDGDLIVAVDGKSTPSLDVALLALVDLSMNGDIVDVTVRDADGRVRTRALDFRDEERLADGGQLLAKLGLAPWRPSLPPIIDKLQPNGAAEKAGLQPGDRVLAVDGQPVEDWNEWAAYVRERANVQISVRIERDGRALDIGVTPAATMTESGTVGLIGAYGRIPENLADSVRVVIRYGPLDAVVESFGKTWDMSLLTLRMLGRMLVGKASLQNLSGPISIAEYAGQSASIGSMAFLSFLAVVSISLGVLNLLPVPVLDGGHLLYYFIELVKGSPLSESWQNLGQRFGIVILLMLMTLALFNDLVRLLG